MKEQMMNLLAKAAEELSVDVRPPYAYVAPHMHGEETHALILPSVKDLLRIVAQSAVSITISDLHRPSQFGPDEFLKECRELRWDHMGRSDIVVY